MRVTLRSGPESLEQMQKKRADGSLFTHKHDTAPTPKQLAGMVLSGFLASDRVHPDVLAASEAGEKEREAGTGLQAQGAGPGAVS